MCGTSCIEKNSQSLVITFFVGMNAQVKTKARTEKKLLPSYSSFFLYFYSHHFWTCSSQNGPTETLHLIGKSPHKSYPAMKKRPNMPKQPLQLKAATKDRGAPQVWRHNKHLINLSYSTIDNPELRKSPHKYGLIGRKHSFFLFFQTSLKISWQYTRRSIYTEKEKTGGIYSISSSFFDNSSQLVSIP